MRVKLALGIVLVIFVSTYYFLTTKKNETSSIIITPTVIPLSPRVTQEVNIRAAFTIFTNGTLRIFTDSRYHNLSTDVYLQADNPNIVHIKKTGITWDLFFKTLPMQVSKECLITGTKQTFCTNENGKLYFYINGNKDNDALLREIKNGDKLLISYGNENEEIRVSQQKYIPQP